MVMLAIGLTPWSTAAQDQNAPLDEVRRIEFEPGSVGHPTGIAYSPGIDAFFLGDARPPPQVHIVSMLGDRGASSTLDVGAGDLQALAFDRAGNRLVVLTSGFGDEIVVIETRGEGDLRGPARRFDVGRFGLSNIRGMTAGPDTRDLFILDRRGARFLRASPAAGGDYAAADLAEINLEGAGLGSLRGIAFNPEDGLLYLLSASSRFRLLHSLTTAGELVSTRNLPELGLGNPTGMVFAPSGDQTDDDDATSLYIIDAGSGGREASIVELSLAAAVTAATAADVATLINTIDTSAFTPPSPDPSGIAYLDHLGTHLISDGEVNEMPIFTGVNFFEMSLSGGLLSTATSIGFSDEPTGISGPRLDASTGRLHIFTTDDDRDRIFEIDPGPDGVHGTGDDSVSSISTRDFTPLSSDPEGITYAAALDKLFIADGVNAEIYGISPGSNGVFDGPPPAGDDVVSNFDTQIHGLSDPEGVEYTPSNTLLAIGKPKGTVFEFTPTGELARTIDISAADPFGLDQPAGLAVVPGSDLDMFIVDRGVDNNSDPDENDGKVFELAVLPVSNQAPVVDAGPNQAVTLPDDVSLDGTITDDGLPDPPSATTSTWSVVSGPGPVAFGDPSAVDTTASFSSEGDYVLRLTADDGELDAFDEVMITVLPEGVALSTIDVRVAAGSDDAEEAEGGSVTTTSSDLEMVFDGGGNQTVGIRFAGVSIPRGAEIIAAYVQFQTDEATSGATSLFIEGEATDDAATFVSSSGSISSRPGTAAVVSWTPPPWPSVNEAGTDQRTPDLTTIIQEIVDRAGWSSGNALALIITGTGERVAESFNGSVAGAPLLHVEYLASSGPPPGNTAPVVTITAPTSPDATVGDSITFEGNATDAEDDDAALTGSLVWTSDLQGGQIGTGGSFSTSALVIGVHTITAEVTDSGGLPGSDQVTVTVSAAPPGNTAPVVTITTPASDPDATVGDSIDFAGGATDMEDGALSGSLVWTSDLQGEIGTGGSFSTSALVIGVHTITAEVTDSGGLPGSDQVTVTVSAPPPGQQRMAVAVADAWVDDGHPDTNHGADSRLEVDQGPSLNIAYLRFDLTDLEGTVVSAVLELYVRDGSDNGGTIHSVSDNTWDEFTLTYANRPDVDGPSLDTLGAVAVRDLVQMDVTAAISGPGIYSFAIVPNSSNGVVYRSREGQVFFPVLILDVVGGPS